MTNDALEIAGESFNSRLFIGTGKFSSGEVLQQTVRNCPFRTRYRGDETGKPRGHG